MFPEIAEPGLASAAAIALLGRHGVNEPHWRVDPPLTIARRVVFDGSIALIMFAIAFLDYVVLPPTSASPLVAALVFGRMAMVTGIHVFAQRNIGDIARKTRHRVVVKRDAQWGRSPPSTLVPGDIVTLELQAMVPADVCILACNGNRTVDYAEMPEHNWRRSHGATQRTARVGGTIPMGSLVLAGVDVVARVERTGMQTEYCKKCVERGAFAVYPEVGDLVQLVSVLTTWTCFIGVVISFIVTHLLL